MLTWVRYDNGGFTGANPDRPVLQHLLTDNQGGAIEAVVIYEAFVID